MVDRDRLPGFVIGVNDSAVRAHCHAAVSMDRLWTEYRWPDLVKIGRQAFIRDAALKNIPVPDRPSWLRAFGCDYKATTFADDPELPWLNGTNSGFCALNLAYLMRPRRIYLFGFDMNRSPNGNPYWFPTYPWSEQQGGATKPGKYAEWSKQFQFASIMFAKQNIDVLNVSPTSAIEVFRKISPSDYEKERDGAA